MLQGRQLIALTGLCLINIGIFAETCPTVDRIQHAALSGWTIYDSEDGKPLTLKETERFKKSISKFILAEWVKKGNNIGAIHCYYRDKTGSDLEAYIAKDNFLLTQSNYWYQVSGAMQCAAGMDKCLFQQQPMTTQLAKS